MTEMTTNMPSEILPDFSKLSESERLEAIRFSEAARRAEERAELRAAERERAKSHALMEERSKVRRDRPQTDASPSVPRDGNSLHDPGGSIGVPASSGRVLFVSKKRRLELASQRILEEKKMKKKTKERRTQENNTTGRGISNSLNGRPSSFSSMRTNNHVTSSSNKVSKIPTAAELAAAKRKRLQKRITFKFEWDDDDDTTNVGKDEPDLLYDDRLRTAVAKTRNRNMKKRDDLMSSRNISHREKPLSAMTPRDWRILREDHDIRVRGTAPPPLRHFDEPGTTTKIHPAILDAVNNTLRYKEPSPIQRQAIPIGMLRRDMIGIAETGSGKTAAFGIPLLHHVLGMRKEVLESVGETGPLALVMAPTRELALQIEEVMKALLSRQRRDSAAMVKSLAVVGGQSVTVQATELRKGIHVVVGTPGRLNDCIETSYLVLDRCTYVVLDEADRMIDMGFAPQIASILDAMGGKMKSTVEVEAYRQEKSDISDNKDGNGVPEYRLTAMFSATMPPEVESIAKTYLRHPAYVSVGDRDSGRNTRIVQRVLFLNGMSHKERALRDILSRSRPDEKIIVFVNEKKNADSTGRMVERCGRRVVVLHGGKAQDQREESLNAFRRGGVVLVATDVAGRGLDVPDVSHVINFDVPSRSIDSYCHRIGRTGRAGQDGLATSFITDEDTGIMPALKAYLESTGAPVPERLARHPAAAGAGGLIDKRDLFLS